MQNSIISILILTYEVYISKLNYRKCGKNEIHKSSWSHFLFILQICDPKSYEGIPNIPELKA